jgi:hypothetical protein
MTRTRLSFVLTMVVASTLGASAFVVVQAPAATKPTVGALCLKSQLGRISSNLICSRSGTRYRWFARTTRAATQSTPAQSTGSTPPAGPSNVEIVSVVLGSAPATNSTSVALTCSGLGSDPQTQTKTVQLGAQSATDQVQFALQAPSVTNPTGSSCIGSVTVQGSTPSALQILVNGRTVAGPVGIATIAVPTFTADGPFVLTVVQGAPGIGASIVGNPGVPTTLPTATGTASSLVPSSIPATTPTTAPINQTAAPASGKPEIRAKFNGTFPPTLLGIDVKVTCTPTVGSTAFQVYSARITPTGLFIVPAAVGAGTSCQIESSLAGVTGPTELRAQISVRGQVIAGPTLGTLINSPAFPATEPFASTIEYTFGPLTPNTGAGTTATIPAATTTPTSTTTTTTTTTIPGTIAVGTGTGTNTGTASASSGFTLVAATGSVPSSVLGYRAQLSCTNVSVGGVNQATYSFTSNFTAAGGSTVYSITGQASSQCQIVVSTLSNSATPATTGTIQVAVNGAPLATGTGSASTPSFSAASPFQVRVSVGY